jgi:hypothetical protein
VDGHDVVAVTEPPTHGGKVDRERSFFAADLKHLVEPTRAEKRATTHDGTTRDESEHAWSGKGVGRGERTARHLHARRIHDTVWADKDAPREKREARIGVEQRHRLRQCAAFLPGIVVRERDIGSARKPDPDVARCRTRIASERDAPHIRIDPPYRSHVPSSDPLSTMMTSGRSGSASNFGSVRSTPRRRFLVIMTTDTAGRMVDTSFAPRSAGRAGRGLKAIADTAHGAHPSRVRGIVLDATAQTPDVLGHGRLSQP